MNHNGNPEGKGLSLRASFIIMFVVSLVIAAALLGITYRTISSFRSLSKATESYIVLEDAAADLLSASDYLTEEAQCYAIIGERRHIDNYFKEANVLKRREKSVELMEEILPDSTALSEIRDALKESVALMQREQYAMLLVLNATNDSNIPESMADVRLREEDLALSPAEKLELAGDMLHDEEYYAQKNLIRSHLSQCVAELKNLTYSTRDEMEERVRVDLRLITIMVVIQSIAVVLMLIITTKLGINPILRAVDHIKHDQSIPIVGANEFRYLATTYNKMYEAYKRSIENLSFKASHDELTGAYNRAGYDLLKNSVDLSTTAILLFDADKFKEVNDHYGHEAGDLMLQKIANVLKKNFRADDYVCRIGGDEFVVMMVHIDKGIKKLIETKIRKINEDLSKGDDGLPPLTLSAGVSLCSKTGSAQEMFHEADIALYHVKDNGRNGCCFYTSGMREKQPND